MESALPSVSPRIILDIYKDIQNKIVKVTVHKYYQSAKPMSQGGLGGRPVPARCARMTLVHALTLIVDI